MTGVPAIDFNGLADAPPGTLGVCASFFEDDVDRPEDGSARAFSLDVDGFNEGAFEYSGSNTVHMNPVNCPLLHSCR